MTTPWPTWKPTNASRYCDPTGNSAAEMVNVSIDPGCAMVVMIVMMEATKFTVLIQQVSF